MRKTQVLRELYQITEWKDDSVYRTKYVETQWVNYDDRNNPPKGYLYAVVSDPDIQSIRTITVEDES